VTGYQNFQAAIATNIVDVTLIARRCTRRTGNCFLYRCWLFPPNRVFTILL